MIQMIKWWNVVWTDVPLWSEVMRESRDHIILEYIWPTLHFFLPQGALVINIYAVIYLIIAPHIHLLHLLYIRTKSLHINCTSTLYWTWLISQWIHGIGKLDNQRPSLCPRTGLIYKFVTTVMITSNIFCSYFIT